MRTQLRIPFRGTKIEANYLNYSAEENTTRVWLSPDRMGPLGKRLANLALLPSRTSQGPVAVCAVTLHSSNSNTSMKQYCDRTQPYCERSNGQQEISSRNLKGFRQINNNHDIHKRQSLLINNHP